MSLLKELLQEMDLELDTSTPMNSETPPEENPVDTITVDVPLFIRLLEWAKEDANTDMDLHALTEKALSLQTASLGSLTMDHYDELVSVMGPPEDEEMPTDIDVDAVTGQH